MATNNATNTGNPITLTQGGTNGSLTASNGGIVYSGSSSLGILPGTATANQALLSGSSSAPTWSTTTYPSTVSANSLLYGSASNTISALASQASSVLTTTSGSVPQWSTTLPGGLGGSLILISQQSASNSASISFTGLSYLNYLLIVDSAVPVTNTATLQMLTSINNGSSYATTGYLSGVTYTAYNSTTLSNAHSTTAIVLADGQSNSSVNPLNGFYYLYNLDTANNFALTGFSTWTDATLAAQALSTALAANSGTGVNAIQLAYSSGNISSGTFTLYAINTS